MRKLLLLSIAFALSTALLAQERTVTGNVSSADEGIGLPGVNVLIQGTTQGTTTDVEGNYSIRVTSNATLIFSFVGYENQQVAVGNQSVINVSLATDISTLEDVVVTAFGLEREKKALTYAAQNVTTEEIAQARPQNVAESLSGKVAGISVIRAGTGVGSDTRVILRGNRSIAGSSQPLYIVDGVPIIGDISDVNPDDIASITVLKGPNAAALYGNRAQNGAIVITTKTGEAGFNVSLNTTFMAERPILLTNYQNEFGQGNSGVYAGNSEQSWGPRLDGSSVAHWSPDPNFTPTSIPFTGQPSNVEDFFQTGHNWATSLAISTGNDRNTTYFSYTFTDSKGIVPNNELEKHNVHLRINNKLTDKLTLDAKVNYIREDLDNRLFTGENFANPIRHAFRLPRNIRTQDAQMFEYTTDDGQNRQHFWNPGSNGGANPYWTVNRNRRNDVTERVVALASLRYEFTEELSVQVRSTIDRLNTAIEERFWNDSYIIADNGRFSVGKGDRYEWNNDILITYAKSLNEDWDFNVNVGGNTRQERGTALSSNTGNALTVPNFFALGNTQLPSTAYNVGFGEGIPRDVNSLYGFAQVAYKNSIFLDLTYRNDWSSTLPDGEWSFGYPSVGLNAVISDLTTLPEFITFAKVRASWAEVGNDTNPFQLQRTANLRAGGISGFLGLSTTIPNANLKPETTQSLEIGADLRFLNNRLGLDISYYKTNTTDQLFTVALPVGSGASNFFTNGGDVENKGIEFVLTGTPVETADLRWDITFNFTRNRSEVVELNDERPSLTVAQDFLREFRIVQGEPFGQVYSRGFQRDAQGRVIVNADGLPAISDGLSVPVANFNPDWLGGIQNYVEYKNLSLSFLIDIRNGGSTASLTNAIIFADGHTEETLQGREGGLVFGDNFFSGETAVLDDGSPNNIAIDAETFWRAMGGRNAPVGEVFALDATNIRLREAVLGYSLPSNVIGGTPFRTVKISLVGRNLFFITNKAENLDPEVAIGTDKAVEGFDSFGPPTTRSFGFNLQLGF